MNEGMLLNGTGRIAICLAAALCAALAGVPSQAEPAKKAPQTSTKKATAKKSSAKTTTAKKSTTAKAPGANGKQTTARKTVPSKKSTTAKTKSRVRVVAKKPSAKVIQARLVAHDAVIKTVAGGASIPVENPAALIPFFEQLYRHQRGEMQGPVRILHYGDSHTAADEWTGELRARYQEKFGDGGSGYSLAGRPYLGYRRMDVRSGSTKGWHADGLVGKAPGDGIYGLGGVSLTTSRPGEQVYLIANAESFELYYYRQPGGGSLQLYDNGMPVDKISTDGEPGPAYYHLDTTPGDHRVDLETVDRAPVRVFGWVAENSRGVTYETLGINGAQASIILDWNQDTLRANLEHRDPALIVLAYGTNEAGRKDWTLESYRDMFIRTIDDFREAAPTATIMLIGPPDREQRTRQGWVAMNQIDMIVEAQRQAALATGCPFWDLRAKMGGKGSMGNWVRAGMAQPDHVHFTGPGYHLLGDAIFADVMSQYDLFLKARRQIVADAAGTTADSGGASDSGQ